MSQSGDERAKFCRYCDGVIEFGTKRCPHCNADLEIVDFDDMDFVGGGAAPPPKVSGLREKPPLPADMERRRKAGPGDTQPMPAMRRGGPADETVDMPAMDADLVPIPTAPVLKPVGGPAGKPPVVPPAVPGGRKPPVLKPPAPLRPPVMKPAAPAGPPPVLKPAAPPPPVLKPAAAPPPVLRPTASPAVPPVMKPVGPEKGPPVLKPRAPAPVLKPVEEAVQAPEEVPATPPPVLKPTPAGLPTGVEPMEPDCPVCGSPIQVAGGTCPACGAEACMPCLMRANGVAVGEDPKANRKAWISFLNKTPPDQVRCAACGLSGVKA